jgi:hypothetical protein
VYSPTMTDSAGNPHSNPDGTGLDLWRIEFPSDRLTVRQVREREPDLDGPHPDFGPSYRRNAESAEPVNSPSLQWVMTWERHVARLAYDIAIGRGPALSKWLAWEMTPREIDEFLGAAYLAYRMADTPVEYRTPSGWHRLPAGVSLLAPAGSRCHPSMAEHHCSAPREIGFARTSRRANIIVAACSPRLASLQSTLHRANLAPRGSGRSAARIDDPCRGDIKTNGS